jgi:rhodanese-related sulfurtransferase
MRVLGESSKSWRRPTVGAAMILVLFVGGASWLALRGAALRGSELRAPQDLEATEAAVRSRYPKVEQLTTDDLARWLANTERAAPVLVDVRTAAEYTTSHLPKARHVEPAAALPAWLLGLPRSTPIVAYCAVGYRSSALVERLEAAGFDRVHNLEGSIFAWANEGRRLVRAGAQTDRGRTGDVSADRVHPYNAAWGRLLDPDRHADVLFID